MDVSKISPAISNTNNGRITPKQIMDNVKAMAAGGHYSLILKTDNTLWATGYNEYGQLGDGTTTNVNTPKQIMGNVKAISAGSRHSLILKTDNTFWGSGNNAFGQLGNNMSTDISTFQKINF